MSFLTPLYLAGLAAVALPILFHLIRRTPQGRQEFSSLMFLAPSPPRFTRRSRLNNILLLILRATVLTLLALAFARPFFQQNVQADVNRTQGRRIALLVDTSASMRRGDLWQQANLQVDQVLSDLQPNDEVALYFFDKRVRPGFTFDQWNALEPGSRVSMLTAALSGASPTYAGTHLADALAVVADQLADNTSARGADATISRQLVLICDLQQGSRLSPLQGYEWPDNVQLTVKPVMLKQSGNASLQLVSQSRQADEDDDSRIRVRVSNELDSTRDQFTLTWANASGPIAAVEPVTTYVAPGRTQIVRIPAPPTEARADRIILSGDDSDFDNTLYVVPRRLDQARLVYLGDDPADDPRTPRYYLASAAGDTAERKVEFVARSSNEPLTNEDLADTRLVVVAGPQPDDRAARLRGYAEQGGVILWILTNTDASGLSRIMGIDSFAIEEAAADDFALLARVSLDHPLFAPFADPRFSDFTKIHFWKHRRVTVPQLPGVQVVAAFDRGDPFLIEQTIAKGRLLVMTSGWHPADSQLALSTKFVPLIGGLLNRRDGGLVQSQYVVLDPIPLPPTTQPADRALRAPDGRTIEIASDAGVIEETTDPGIYHLTSAGEQIALAVNLPPDESRTSPLAVEDLEHAGAKLEIAKGSAEAQAEQQRLLKIGELENRQKIWRWVIVAVLGVLVLETALAGHLAHRTTQQQVQA